MPIWDLKLRTHVCMMLIVRMREDRQPGSIITAQVASLLVCTAVRTPWAVQGVGHSCGIRQLQTKDSSLQLRWRSQLCLPVLTTRDSLRPEQCSFSRLNVTATWLVGHAGSATLCVPAKAQQQLEQTQQSAAYIRSTLRPCVLPRTSVMVLLVKAAASLRGA